jgi:hypothetical protein
MQENYNSCRHITLDEFEHLPIVLRSSTEISVTPAQLFDSLEGVDDWLTWVPLLRKITWTSPRPFQVGTTRTVEMINGSIGAEEFIAWEQDRRMAFRFNEGSLEKLAALGEDYLIEETPTGCRLTWTMVIDFSGFIGSLLALMGPLLRWNHRRYLKGLKALLEARHVQA